MGRILAIDYGEKRSGLAVTDELQLIASGLTAIDTVDLMNFLSAYLAREDIESVVIGLPKRLNNQNSEIEPVIQAFIKSFLEHFPDMPVYRVDERFTSKIASRSLYDSGMKRKKRQDKYLLDEVSATLILQSYLDSR